MVGTKLQSTVRELRQSIADLLDEIPVLTRTLVPGGPDFSPSNFLKGEGVFVDGPQAEKRLNELLQRTWKALEAVSGLDLSALSPHSDRLRAELTALRRRLAPVHPHLSARGDTREFFVDREHIPILFMQSLRAHAELLQKLDTENATDIPASPTEAGSSACPITIDQKRQTAWVDEIDKPIDLTTSQAQVLERLVEADGEWMPSKALRTGGRVDKLIGRLPEAIKKWVESRKGRGYRIRRRDEPAST